MVMCSYITLTNAFLSIYVVLPICNDGCMSKYHLQVEARCVMWLGGKANELLFMMIGVFGSWHLNTFQCIFVLAPLTNAGELSIYATRERLVNHLVNNLHHTRCKCLFILTLAVNVRPRIRNKRS